MNRFRVDPPWAGPGYQPCSVAFRGGTTSKTLTGPIRLPLLN